jgi:hypothetical protein
VQLPPQSQLEFPQPDMFAIKSFRGGGFCGFGLRFRVRR